MKPIEFDCVDCAHHIFALGVTEIPPDRRCATCQWLNESVADEAERAELRRRLHLDC